MIASYPENNPEGSLMPSTSKLPTRDEALRKAVFYATRASDYVADDRGERLAGVTAYAALSAAWTNIAWVIGEGGQ
jgi:hypothetical protein